MPSSKNNPFTRLLTAMLKKAGGSKPNVNLNKDPMKTTRQRTAFNPLGALALAGGGLFAFALGARATKKVDRAGGGGSKNMIDDNEQATVNNIHKLHLYHAKRAAKAKECAEQLQEAAKVALAILDAEMKQSEMAKGAVQGHVTAYLKN